METVVFVLWLMLDPPRAGVEIELALYREHGSVWVEQIGGRCVTDAAGACVLRGRAPVWEDGLARGLLRWDGEERPLIWPGGEMALDLTASVPGEGRYDGLPAVGAPQIERAERAPNFCLLLLAGVVLAGSAAHFVKERRR